MSRIYEFFIGFLNYELFRVDNQPFSVLRLVLGIAMLVLSYWVASRVADTLENRFFKRLEIEDSLRYTLSRFTFYVLLVVAVLFTLRVLNIPITIFTVLGGALAIGIGFGSQNLVNNFMSGLLVMVERPLRVGDFVEIESLSGHVEKIGIRASILNTLNNTRVVVPNKNLIENSLTNWTLSDDLQCTAVEVGVAYGSDTELVAKVLVEATNSVEEVLKDRPIVPLFTNFGNSSLDFSVVFWTKARNIRERRYIESKVRFRIDAIFREHHIQIPFPQRDIHLDFDQNRPIPIVMKEPRGH